MLEPIHKEIDRLHKDFIDKRKSGHFAITLSYYEGGLTKPKKEIVESLDVGKMTESDKELE